MKTPTSIWPTPNSFLFTIVVMLNCIILSGCSSQGESEYRKALSYLDKGNTKEAVHLLEEASNMGFGKASSKLSELYDKGEVIEPDKATCLKYLRLAAEQGDAESQVSLGSIMISGVEGVEYDAAKAAFWLRSALSNTKDKKIKVKIANICESQVIALRTDQEKKYADIARIALDEMIREKEPTACAIMADIVDAGYEYKQDDVLVSSDTLWQIAADKGHPKACMHLAIKFATTDTTSYDPSKAVLYFGHCEKLNCNDVALYVRCLLEKHERRDAVKAVEIANNALNGRYEGVLLNDNRAFFYYALGNCLLYGDGVDKNIDAAIRNFEKSAEESNDEARLKLAELYYEGDVVPKDIDKADSYVSMIYPKNGKAKPLVEKIKREKAEISARKREEREAKLARNREEWEAERAKEKEDEAAQHKASQESYAKYAEETLSKISFNLNDYVILHPYLRKQIKSAKVKDESWRKLIETQNKKDWLGMLNVLRPLTYDYQDYTEFPSTNTIDGCVRKLLEHKFELVFVLKDHNLYKDLALICFMDYSIGLEQNTFFPADALCPRLIKGEDSIVGAALNFRMSDKVLLGQSNGNSSLSINGVDGYKDLNEKYKKKERAIKAKVSLGEIDGNREKDALHEIHESFHNEVIARFTKSKWRENNEVKKTETGYSPRKSKTSKQKKEVYRLQGPVPVGW